MINTKILAVAPLLLAIYGCSGSSDSQVTAPPTTATSGVFLDAEVKGLSYTTDSGISGTTDENGTYSFLPGENVSFSVGGVSLGTVAGAPICTPFDFAAASTNIARFIQSLDADGDPSNGIDLVAANIALADTIINSAAFTVDTATFEANPDIAAALVTTDNTLIAEQEALDNLNAGTDTTFDNAELEGKIFVVIDPVESDIGIISFDTIASGAEVFSVFANDTIAAGSDGQGTDETWVVGSDGVLTLTDLFDGSVTTVNRVGGSSRSISVTYSEDGSASLPATLLIPQINTAALLGGDGIAVASKNYDVIDVDGTPINITFYSDGSFIDDSAIGNYADEGTPNVITIIDSDTPTEITFMILIDGDISVVGETASILLLGATIVGGVEPDLDLVFDDIGVASLTLVSTTVPVP